MISARRKLGEAKWLRQSERVKTKWNQSGGQTKSDGSGERGKRAMSGGDRVGGAPGNGCWDRRIVCYGCGQEGHIHWECPDSECSWGDVYAIVAQVGVDGHLGWGVAAWVNGNPQ